MRVQDEESGCPFAREKCEDLYGRAGIFGGRCGYLSNEMGADYEYKGKDSRGRIEKSSNDSIGYVWVGNGIRVIRGFE